MSWYLELGGRVNSEYFKRNIVFSYDNPDIYNEIERFKLSCNNTDVYVCTYSFNNTDRDKAFIYSDIYFDLDGDISTDKEYEVLRTKAKILLCAIKAKLLLKDGDVDIFFSGSKGFHFIIPASIFGIAPSPFLNISYKQLSLYFKSLIDDSDGFIDTKIYDNKRLLRMSNTINSKTGLYKVQISEHQLYNFSREDMISYASSSKAIFHNSNTDLRTECKDALDSIYVSEEQKRIKNEIEAKRNTKAFISKEKRNLLPCVRKLLATSAEKGYRNNTLVLIASGLLQANYSEQETLDIVREWNRANKPRLQDYELRCTVKSANNMHLNNRHYGCSAFKDMDACSDTCWIHN